jgi:hypothetical protein
MELKERWYWWNGSFVLLYDSPHFPHNSPSFLFNPSFLTFTHHVLFLSSFMMNHPLFLPRLTPIVLLFHHCFPFCSSTSCALSDCMVVMPCIVSLKFGKYGDTGVWRWSTECTRRQITRTLASTYVLCPRELLVQYFGGLEYESGGQGGRRTGGVPDIQVDKEFN